MFNLFFLSVVGITVIPILIYKFYKDKKLKSLYGIVLLTVIIVTWVVPIAIKSVFEPSSTDAILGFYGDLLSFVGTISLGALALWQNHLYKTEKDEAERKYCVPEFKAKLEGDVVNGKAMKLVITNVCRKYICKVVCGETRLHIEQEFVVINSYEKVEIELGDKFDITKNDIRNGTNLCALIKLKCEDSMGIEHFFVFEVDRYNGLLDGEYFIRNNIKITREQYDTIKNKAFKQRGNTDELNEFYDLRKSLFKNY